MRGSRKFRQGGPGQFDKKNSSDKVVFFLVFLVLSLFYRNQMVNFKEIYHFSRFQRGSNIFQGGGGGGGGGGGPSFSRGGGGGGSNCLFPIETHITCDFPGGGGVPTPCPPSGSALVCLQSQSCGYSHCRHQTSKWMKLSLKSELSRVRSSVIVIRSA